MSDGLGPAACCSSSAIRGAWVTRPTPTAYGDAGADTLGNTSRAVGGLHVPNLESLGLGHLTGDRRGRAAGRPRHGARPGHRAVGRQGHDHRALGDDGDPARRAVPAVPGRVPARDHRSRSRRRSGAGSSATSRRRAPRSSRSSATSTSGPASPSSTRAATPCSRSRRTRTSCRCRTLYEWCRVARRLLTGDHTVGPGDRPSVRRAAGAFVRSPERRDFAVPPPGPTVLDSLPAAGVPVYGVGKIQDIFSGQGITEGRYSDSNDHGVDLTLDYLERPSPAFVFTNLVDFDSKYGHRNDPAGYAKAIEAFDRRLPELIGRARRRRPVHHRRPRLRPDDAIDRPHPRADPAARRPGCPGGPHEIGTRGHVRRSGTHDRPAARRRGRGPRRAELRAIGSGSREPRRSPRRRRRASATGRRSPPDDDRGVRSRVHRRRRLRRARRPRS